MALSNPLDVLLAHDRWATTQIFQACAGLTPEQFHRKFEMGPGSLHNTGTHILASMRVWADALAGRADRPRLDQDGKQRSAAELLAIHNELSDDVAALAKSHPVEGTVVRTFGSKTYHYTRGGILTHIATHGMHHRAQCLNMLRHVGVNPLPQSSVTEWMRMIEAS